MPSGRANRCSRHVRWIAFPNVIAAVLRAALRRLSAVVVGLRAKAAPMIARVDPMIAPAVRVIAPADPTIALAGPTIVLVGQAAAVRANPRENHG